MVYVPGRPIKLKKHSVLWHGLASKIKILFLENLKGSNKKIHLQIQLQITHYSLETHSRTSRLNCFCRFPRNSPIICLLKPFLCSRKWATPTGVSGTKFRSIRYWMPFSGFLETHERVERETEWDKKKEWSPNLWLSHCTSAPGQMCVRWGTGFRVAGKEVVELDDGWVGRRELLFSAVSTTITD